MMNTLAITANKERSDAELLAHHKQEIERLQLAKAGATRPKTADNVRR
jgi:hypothetical protein